MNPPVIVIHGNSLEHVTDAYKRFLEGRFRKEFDLVGTPCASSSRRRATLSPTKARLSKEHRGRAQLYCGIAPVRLENALCCGIVTASSFFDTENIVSNKGQLLQDPFLNAFGGTCTGLHLLSQRIKLQGQIESFDQYVVLLRNTVTQMVYKHAISTIVRTRREFCSRRG